MALGALVRHFFNLRHVGRNAWWIPATAVVGFGLVAFLIRPNNTAVQGAAASGQPAVSFAKANAVIQQRCVPCHSANPKQPGFATAPAGIRLDTRAEIEAQAAAIRQQAVVLKAMPLGNVTHMTQPERDLLARWLASR